MNKRCVLIFGLLASISVYFLLGCSGNNALTNTGNSLTPSSSATGTVKVRFASYTTRAITIPADFPVTFSGISLLNADTSETAPDPANWLGSFSATNPNIPIPIVNGPTLVDLMSGTSQTTYTDLTTTQVPAQLYSKIRLLFNPADFSGLSNLPVNASQLKQIIPIVGGMQVNPQQTVTLLVNFFGGQATVDNSSN